MYRWFGLAMAIMALVLGLGPVARGGDGRPVTVKVTTSEGQAVPLLPEDLTGLSSRPLIKVREALDKKIHNGFFSLYRVPAKAGTELVGEYNVTTVPCRLTVYQISKRNGAGRELRVVATGYHVKPEKAVFRQRVEKLEENVFFITAEKVAAATELNSHLRYMESQGNAILLKGYGTNFDLSMLKLKMAGKNTGNDHGAIEFEKDAHWLVAQLINPLWLMSVRIESE